MALCIGLEGVGLTKYNDRRITKRIKGRSHVCFKQVSLKRRGSERLLRRLECDLEDFSGDVRGCGSC